MRLPVQRVDDPGAQRNFEVLQKQLSPTLHVIGDPGEPTFENSWTNYDTSVWGSAAFWKEGHTVHLFGLVSRTGTAAASVIFTLPTGYRPTSNGMFAVATGESGQFGRVHVITDGTVHWVQGGTTEQDYTSLSGISFWVA